jgi:Uma2 family endonuclease
VNQSFPAGSVGSRPAATNDTIRCPDVSFVAAGRLPTEPAGNDWFTLAPDFVVEVLSPDERHGDLLQKLDDYLGAGTPLAWVVDPRRFGVEVHLPDRSTRWVPAGEVLDGGLVLPDFRLAVDAIFAGVARPR